MESTGLVENFVRISSPLHRFRALFVHSVLMNILKYADSFFVFTFPCLYLYFKLTRYFSGLFFFFCFIPGS